jgi:hypothetical protein
VVTLTRLKRRCLLLSPALLGLGAVALASCVGEKSKMPTQAVAAQPSAPSPQEISPGSHTVPRPARKPTPPSPTEDSAAATGGEAVAMTEPKPSAGSVSEPLSPPVDATGGASSANSARSLPPQVELIGLDQPAVTRLFGPAAERSEEPPATVWRYKSATCELDLFFYLDLRSGHMRTLHYTLKDGASGPAPRQNCLRSLIASRGN